MPQIEAPLRPTVLVVDDSPDQVLVLVALLKGVCRVKVAAGGAEGLALARGPEPPDLILLDVMMPEMDGFEVCRKLKQDPRTREIPVLFLTSKDAGNFQARGFAAGAADYIPKPFSPALVLARVRTHLEQRRLLAVERALVSTTLKGSLAIILALVAMGDPRGADWIGRLSDLAERTAEQMGMEAPWMVGLAAALGRIGTLTVSQALMGKVKGGTMLNSEERLAYSQIPETASALLGGIPGLEQVAEMVRYSQKNFDGRGYPLDATKGEDLPMGARILRVCLDFVNSPQQDQKSGQRISDMRGRTSMYDPAVTAVLKQLLDEGYFTPLPRPAKAARPPMALDSLVLGQVLENSVETMDGKLLLRQGTVLEAHHLTSLAKLHRTGAIRGRITATDWTGNP